MSNSREFLIGLYRTMYLIRLCEEAFVEPILSGEIGCPVHLYSGQEAVAVGVSAALADGDYVFGTHRSHGHFLAKGGDIRSMVAEVFCRETGCARGRGGSMHVIEPRTGMLGAAPIVAGTISLAVGAALASVVRGEDRVTVAFFGDGAAGEGVLYSSMNLASLWKLPILFLCENNLYSTHLRIEECHVSQELHRVAEPFGIWSQSVDGNDVLAVFEAAKEAVGQLRIGRGPAFLECKTYRMRGHVGPDDNIQGTHTDLRPAQEIDAWRARDPVQAFEHHLLGHGISAEEMGHLHHEVELEVADAFSFARDSSTPHPEEISKYVFA